MMAVRWCDVFYN